MKRRYGNVIVATFDFGRQVAIAAQLPNGERTAMRADVAYPRRTPQVRRAVQHLIPAFRAHLDRLYEVTHAH